MKYESHSSIVTAYGVFVEQGHPWLCRHVLIDGVRVNDPWGRLNFWNSKPNDQLGGGFAAAMKPLQEWCHQQGFKLESVRIESELSL